jgi:hypothetical protein
MDRKQMKRAYKEAVKSMGVYRIKNLAEGRSLYGASHDLDARLNRHRAELNFGVHRNPTLQADWKRLGAEAFAFEVIERLRPPKDEPDFDPSADLEALLELVQEREGHDASQLYLGVTV